MRESAGVLSLVAALTLLAPELPPVCQAPPTREVASLAAFSKSAGSLSVGLDSVATWCFDSGGTWTGGHKPVKGKLPATREPTGDCAKAIISCEAAKASVSGELSQLLYDALADLERPFLGVKYKPKRSGLAERPPEAADCGGRDRSVLFTHAQARMDLARLANQVQHEYANYKTWLFSEGLKCAQAVARGEKDLTRRGVGIDRPVQGGGTQQVPVVARDGDAAQAGTTGAATSGTGAAGPTGSTGGATASAGGSGTAGTASASGGARPGDPTGGTGGSLAPGPSAAKSLGTSGATGTGGAAGVGGATGSGAAGTTGAGSGRGPMGTGSSAVTGTGSAGTSGVAGSGALAGSNPMGGGSSAAPGTTGTSGASGTGGTAGTSGTPLAAAAGAAMPRPSGGGSGTGGTTGGTTTGGVGATGPGGTTVASAGTLPLGGPTAAREKALASAMMDKWRYFAAERARLESDPDWSQGFMASRELRECRCARAQPGELVKRLEAKDRVTALESEDEKLTRCEICLQDVYPRWKGRAQKQCSLAMELTEFELSALEKSDDGNGLPPRCLEAARAKAKGGAVAVAPAPGSQRVVEVTPRPKGGTGAGSGSGAFIISRDPGATGAAGSGSDFVRPNDYAPMIAREDGRVYVRVFTSSACVAEVLPGPVQARTGDLLPVPTSANEITVRGPCGGFAEVYFGREEKPRVSESFARNQPLRLQFRQ